MEIPKFEFTYGAPVKITGGFFVNQSGKVRAFYFDSIKSKTRNGKVTSYDIRLNDGHLAEKVSVEDLEAFDGGDHV